MASEGGDVGMCALMRKMGVEALYRKPNISRRNSRAGIFPYLLRDLAITRPNHVWTADITSS